MKVNTKFWQIDCIVFNSINVCSLCSVQRRCGTQYHKITTTMKITTGVVLTFLVKKRLWDFISESFRTHKIIIELMLNGIRWCRKPLIWKMWKGTSRVQLPNSRGPSIPPPWCQHLYEYSTHLRLVCYRVSTCWFKSPTLWALTESSLKL